MFPALAAPVGRAALESQVEGNGGANDRDEHAGCTQPLQTQQVRLDLADLDTVERAAAELRDVCSRVGAVINNAGVMQTPQLKTKQGYELQLGTNHLGHFRLNSLLMPRLEADGARIVAVSSVAHRSGTIQLDDLNFETTPYDAMQAYSQSKRANLMYGFELQRRLHARQSSCTAYAAHPGDSATNLQSAGVGLEGGSKFFRGLYKVTNALVAQSAEKGAFPLVLAAAAPDAKPGAYYGPTRMMQARGPVGESFVDPKAKDEAIAKGLWEQTERLVGNLFAD